MEQTAPLRPLPQLVFRVLILGRANAGKTSILQRVCETTESPKIYRVGSDGNRKKIQLEPTSQRGHHTITDEYIFANHRGYVFHDSCGFEGGDTKQWEEVQEFIHDRSTRKKLRDRLHAIWFCVPMDQHQRACLDIATFDKICPDKNVPVIVLFTKYEAFKSNMKINLEDEAEEKDVVIDDIEKLTQEECRKFFKNQCLRKIGSAPYVQLEKMHEDNQRCQELVDTTMAALNPAVVSLMLLAVQQGNVELSIRWAVRESRGDQDPVRKCLMGFPVLWLWDLAAADAAAADDDDLLARDADDALLLDQLRPVIQHFTETIPNGPTALIIVTLILLRHTTHLYLRSQTTATDALKQASDLYLTADMQTRVCSWLDTYCNPTDEELIQFILSCNSL